MRVLDYLVGFRRTPLNAKIHRRFCIGMLLFLALCLNSPLVTLASTRSVNSQVRSEWLSFLPAGMQSIRSPLSLTGPILGPVSELTPSPVEKYARYEVSFSVRTVATNPYFPYDATAPQEVDRGTGITVDMLLLPPGESNWGNALSLPCFYYQPVEQMGSGSSVALLPVGQPEWRARFTPEQTGAWQYKIRATDASGTQESAIQQFAVVTSDKKGFVRVSPTDSRFFELSDGTPLVAPLISLEQGSPFNTLASIRANIRKLGENGLRFVRWFPTGEGANYFVAPFGDTMRINWGFGASWTTIDDVDTVAGKRFSFTPYYYSGQTIPAVPGAEYRLSFSAKVSGERMLRAELGNLGRIDIGSATSTYHEANGRGDVCSYKQDGWHDYVLEVTNSTATTLSAYLRGLYVSSDAPTPYNSEQSGSIRMHSIQLQRDETGNGDWGPNLLTRSDPDTYNYVDQRSAARLDEIMRLSEQYGVYHKLPLFHKNDYVLNRFQPDGSVGSDTGVYNSNFYSLQGQAARWYEYAYARYFIARWSYSPALHSLELANENHLRTDSYEAGFALAEYVHRTSPRHILMTNSFWGYFVSNVFCDPDRGHLFDYADKHWYANTNSTNGEVISTIWNDSAAYVREGWVRFNDYRVGFKYNKPIVRGEGGVAQYATEPQHPDILRDPTGTYYHKKLWAHVGTLGYTCDGEWYPRLFVLSVVGQFPSPDNDLGRMFAAYDRFVQGEPLSNGKYEAIGTDLRWTNQVLMADSTGNLRAWGARDALAGRALLWIDNADQTWKNVVDGVTISPASGTLTLQGLPQGTYTVEWWDTRTGLVTGSDTASVAADGCLNLRVDNLTTDKAVKVRREVTTSIILHQGWNLISLPVAPISGSISDILSTVVGNYDRVCTYDRSGTTGVWTCYCPSDPASMDSQIVVDPARGVWVHMTQSASLQVRGSIVDSVSIPLRAGWNMVGYPGSSAQPVQEALASIQGKYELVYTYDPLAADQWKKYQPDRMPALNSLTEMTPGQGYWLKVNQDCTWVVPI